MFRLFMNRFGNYIYYIIIAVVSILAVFILPMLGSELGLKWNIPNTIIGWIVYITCALLIALANMLIFHSFIKQAELNVKSNEHYKEACQILLDLELKNPKAQALPRSPKQWKAQTYGTKGTTLFIFSIFGVVALSNAVLRFDINSLVSYIITIILALIFGIIQMKITEQYWIDEYYKYAKYKLNESKRSDLNGLES